MNLLMICRAVCSRREFLQLANSAPFHGTTLTLTCCDDQLLLEPGTQARHCWVRAFPAPDSAELAARALDGSDLVRKQQLQTLLVPAVDAATGDALGIPVTQAGDAGELESQLMLIEGSVTDEAAIEQYRQIIMPLIGGLGGRYLAYAGVDQVLVRHGEWDELFLALSHWSGERSAKQFWQGTRYQGDAIPARTGAGRFGVALMPGPQSQIWQAARAKQVVRDFLDGLWSGDRGKAKAQIGDDAQWWFLPSLGYERPMRPRDAIDIVMDDMIARFDADKPFEVQLHHLLADGGEVVAEYTATGTTLSGRQYEHRYCLRASVSDGRIQSLRPWADTKYFLDTLFA